MALVSGLDSRFNLEVAGGDLPEGERAGGRRRQLVDAVSRPPADRQFPGVVSASRWGRHETGRKLALESKVAGAVSCSSAGQVYREETGADWAKGI